MYTNFPAMRPRAAAVPALALGLLAALAGACGGRGRDPALERKVARFSALMDELGPRGADLRPFVAASEHSRRLSREGRQAEAAAVLDEAIRGLEALRPGAAPAAQPLAEDWAWSGELGEAEQTEPLANELALVISDSDYPHIPGFLGAMSARGIAIHRAKADDWTALRKARITAVLGGPGSGDGVGRLVRKLLSAAELRSAAVEPSVFLRSNAFRPRQSVLVFCAASPEALGRLAVERDMDAYERVVPPLTRGHPRFARLHSAVSRDGVRWTEEGDARLAGISVPEILRTGEGWRLYFIDGQSGGPGCAFSRNGRLWRFERLRARGVPYPGGPGLADLQVVRLDDGRWRMFFILGQRPGAPPNAGLLSAVSEDGLNFELEEGLRFAEPSLVDPEVHKMGEGWRLYYPSRRAGRIETAVSRDGGLSFAREGALELRSAGSFDVVAADGGWRMYLNAEPGMLVLRSADGLHWSREGALDFPARNAAVARLPDGSWRMFFNR